LHGDGAAVVGHDPISNGKSQPTSVASGGEVGVEEAIQVFWRDADALIDYDEGDPLFLVVDLEAGGDVDGAALRHGLHGVDEDV
jgi:hypothetical protein